MVFVATGDRIKEARERHAPRLTQEQLANLAGIKRTRLAQYEAGRTEPPPKVLGMIAKALKVRPSDLFEEDAPPKPVPVITPKPLRSEPTGKLKVYGAISAGDGNIAEVDASELDVPAQFARDDFFGMYIDGDSMADELLPSDLCIFKEWSFFKPGGFVHAAQLESGEWVAKLAVQTAGNVVLRPYNPAYPDINKAFRLTGFLVGLIRDTGAERMIRMNPYGLRLSNAPIRV